MGYVWCDGYVWDMCGVRYVWDMRGVRYANNLLKNPATKRLSGKKMSSFCFFFLFWSLSDIDFWHLPSSTLERSHGLELELVCGALVVEHRKQFGILYMVDHTGRGSGQLGFARF